MNKIYLDFLLAFLTGIWILLLVGSFPELISLLLLSNITLALVIWRILK